MQVVAVISANVQWSYTRIAKQPLLVEVKMVSAAVTFPVASLRIPHVLGIHAQLSLAMVTGRVYVTELMLLISLAHAKLNWHSKVMVGCPIQKYFNQDFTVFGQRTKMAFTLVTAFSPSNFPVQVWHSDFVYRTPAQWENGRVI